MMKITTAVLGLLILGATHAQAFEYVKVGSTFLDQNRKPAPIDGVGTPVKVHGTDLIAIITNDHVSGGDQRESLVVKTKDGKVLPTLARCVDADHDVAVVFADEKMGSALVPLVQDGEGRKGKIHLAGNSRSILGTKRADALHGESRFFLLYPDWIQGEVREGRFKNAFMVDRKDSGFIFSLGIPFFNPVTGDLSFGMKIRPGVSGSALFDEATPTDANLLGIASGFLRDYDQTFFSNVFDALVLIEEYKTNKVCKPKSKTHRKVHTAPNGEHLIYTVWDTPLGMISEIVPAQSYSGNGGGSDGGGSGVPLRQESALPLNHWERLGIGPGVMLDGKAVIAFRFREKGAPHREEIYFADRSAIQRMRPGRGDYEVTPIYEGADLLEFVQNKVNTKDTCFEMTGDGNPKAGRGRSVQSARVTSKGMEFDIHAFLPRKTWLHFELDKKGVLVGGEDKVFTPIIRVKDDKGKICRVNLSNFFFKSGASKLWPLSSSVGRSDITNTEPEQPELTVSAEGEEDHPVFIDMAHPMTCKEGGLRESQDCAECRRTKESELLKLPNIEALGLK